MARKSASNFVKGAALTGGAATIGSGVASAGNTTMLPCPADDKSFYCQFARFFSMFKMVIFVIAVFVVLYFLWKMFI